MAINDNTSYELFGYQVKDLATKIKSKAEAASLAPVATSGLYSDLTGKPTIPTVYNGTLTIQQNGTTVDTFTANSSADKTVNIETITAETVAPAEEVGAITTNVIADGAVTAAKIDWSTIVTVLYDGGTTGTTGSVTLSESAANFSRLKIFYRNNDSFYNSVEVWQPQGKTVTLICDSAPSGNSWYGKVGTYSVSGTSLTKARSLQIPAGGSAGTVSDGYIVVTRVEGWKI